RGGLDWEPLTELVEAGFQQPEGFRSAAETVQAYRDMLEMLGGFVAEEIAPHANEIDRQGLIFSQGEVTFPPRLAGIFAKMKELELYGISGPRELGGMNCPLLLYFVAGEVIGRGDVSVLSQYGFHAAIAAALLAYSVDEGTTTYDAERRVITQCRFE